MRIEPMTSSLPKKCSAAELRRRYVILADWWGVKDSNLRRHSPTDLQSVPIGHSGNSPAERK